MSVLYGGVSVLGAITIKKYVIGSPASIRNFSVWRKAMFTFYPVHACYRCLYISPLRSWKLINGGRNSSVATVYSETVPHKTLSSINQSTNLCLRNRSCINQLSYRGPIVHRTSLTASNFWRVRQYTSPQLKGFTRNHFDCVLLARSLSFSPCLVMYGPAK